MTRSLRNVRELMVIHLLTNITKQATFSFNVIDVTIVKSNLFEYPLVFYLELLLQYPQE